MIEVKKYIVSMMQTNCFIIKDTKSNESAIVDPGAVTKELLKEIQKSEYKFKYILLTHGHFDHIAGANEVKNITGAKIVICQKEKEFIENKDLNLSDLFYKGGLPKTNVDIFVDENQDVLSLGEYNIKVIETPGHTIGGCCYLIGENLFTGDTVMQGTIGRTDFPTGSYKQIIKSVKKLISLSKNYNLYCGHGDDTTLEREISSNEYFGM